MKALAIHEHGGVDKLQIVDLPKPSIGPDDVLINVKAMALNHLDLFVRQGLPTLKLPMPHVPGSDFAGVIAEVGAATWQKTLRSLRRGGRMVVIGATTGANPPEEIRQIFWKQIEIIGSTMSNQREFREVMKLVFRGELRPIIDSVMPLERAREAHERLAKGEQFGKIVLKIGD